MTHLTMTVYTLLAVLAIHGSVLTMRISSNPSLVLAFSWVILPLKVHINVSILILTKYSSLGMSFSMSLSFHFHRVTQNSTESWSHSSLSLNSSPIIHVPIHHASNMSVTHMQDTTQDIIASSLSDVEPSTSPSPESLQPTSFAPPQNPPSIHTHTMTTRSQNNIFQPKQINLITKHPLP